MGNIASDQKKKPRSLYELSPQIGEYKTINEGDPEMVEDPEFPNQMMKDALNNNTTVEGNNVQGTFVYYPNKDKPKMWIGNYKILNPEDILCTNVAEKIGISEEQWKNYIKIKNTTQNEENIIQNNANQTNQPLEEFISLKENLTGKKNIEKNDLSNDELENNSTDLNKINNIINNNTTSYIISSNGKKDIHNCEENYYSACNTIEGIEDKIENNKNRKEKNIEQERDALFTKTYIDKLNEEIKKINKEHENVIIEKQKEVYEYSMSSTSELVDPQKKEKKKESYVNNKINSVKKINNKNNNSSNTIDSKKSIIEQLIEENKNKFNSKRIAVNDAYKKKYLKYSSMSTKDSLMETHSSLQEILSNKMCDKRKIVK
ncbi:conserved protein, unknown function [Plasmodium yoelii]|uniref:Uncharacterized protein n=2 Tax=Plasmodium yoelii TaxID=5861 RepID=A0AAF0B519_PLAYO|nr:conserved protein, unknown function [Plasmodium yoelii]WBY57854.1 hypothetical protein Py17XNL_001002165 [Plasmodium yoelii yoelii]CDU84950.1 conserved Plasmodium protein, unknown function [Plasmodium yoelii]VTZ78846.1 conserved protein, unknown function [Plasmodium yoelii]|eukprot:XP_022813274.1 conserved protein, unknown function [Plasmodium yoelii]